MKIKEKSKNALILQGVPGTLRWMIMLILIGSGVGASCVAFARKLWMEQGISMVLFPLGIGLLIGFALLLVGVLQLFARERLVLDRQRGKGIYESNSPIVTTEKPFKFSLADVNAVIVITATLDTNYSAADSGTLEAKFCKAELRVNKPRRAVMLDETQNGQYKRVTALAEEVADFLEQKVERVADGT